MDIREVPRILFEEFTQSTKTKGKKLIGQAINGFWLVLEERASGRVYLSVYRSEHHIDDYSSSRVFAEIVAGPRENGVWAHGKGNQLEETIEIEISRQFGPLELHFMAPMIFFIAQIVFRAIQIINEMPFEVKQYWSGDIRRMESMFDNLSNGQQ